MSRGFDDYIVIQEGKLPPLREGIASPTEHVAGVPLSFLCQRNLIFTFRLARHIVITGQVFHCLCFRLTLKLS